MPPRPRRRLQTMRANLQKDYDAAWTTLFTSPDLDLTVVEQLHVLLDKRLSAVTLIPEEKLAIIRRHFDNTLRLEGHLVDADKTASYSAVVFEAQVNVLKSLATRARQQVSQLFCVASVKDFINIYVCLENICYFELHCLLKCAKPYRIEKKFPEARRLAHQAEQVFEVCTEQLNRLQRLHNRDGQPLVVGFTNAVTDAFIELAKIELTEQFDKTPLDARAALQVWFDSMRRFCPDAAHWLSYFDKSLVGFTPQTSPRLSLPPEKKDADLLKVVANINAFSLEDGLVLLRHCINNLDELSIALRVESVEQLLLFLSRAFDCFEQSQLDAEDVRCFGELVPLVGVLFGQLTELPDLRKRFKKIKQRWGLLEKQYTQTREQALQQVACSERAQQQLEQLLQKEAALELLAQKKTDTKPKKMVSTGATNKLGQSSYQEVVAALPEKLDGYYDLGTFQGYEAIYAQLLDMLSDSTETLILVEKAKLYLHIADCDVYFSFYYLKQSDYELALSHSQKSLGYYQKALALPVLAQQEKVVDLAWSNRVAQTFETVPMQLDSLRSALAKNTNVAAVPMLATCDALRESMQSLHARIRCLTPERSRSLDAIPLPVLRVINTLRDLDYRVLLVGGCVRDIQIGLPSHDYDIRTNASIKVVLALFPGSIKRGNRQPLVALPCSPGVEIEVVSYAGTAWDEQALMADFTCNALVSEGICIAATVPDVLQDINAGVVRSVKKAEQSVRSDPVRILRACRFAARFSWTLDKALAHAIIQHKELLNAEKFNNFGLVNADRINYELDRLFFSGFGLASFQQLQYFGLLDTLFPPLTRLTLEQREAVFEKLANILTQSDAVADRDEKYWSCLFYSALIWGYIRANHDETLLRQYSESELQNVRSDSVTALSCCSNLMVHIFHGAGTALKSLMTFEAPEPGSLAFTLLDLFEPKLHQPAHIKHCTSAH